MVQTTVKHYVAAVGQKLGHDPCELVADLDKLSPTVNANIESELRDLKAKNMSSQEKGSSRTVTLNDSFYEIQNSLNSKPSHSSNLARVPAAHLQNQQCQRVTLQVASALVQDLATLSTPVEISMPSLPELSSAIPQPDDSNRP